MADQMDDTSSSNTNLAVSSPSLRFTGVQLYFFRRKQGFNCVPSKGGTTLGMDARHFDEHRVSFDSGHGDGEEDLEGQFESSNNLSFDGDESNEDDNSRPPRKRPNSPSLVQEKSSLAELRPLPVRQRRRLLRLSGVKKIDTTERFECEAIRLSRNECGCQSCGPVCLPDTCPCSVNGIACQVDKMAYPCSCTREGCRNVEGRVEFNAVRVRRHLIHTLSKLYAAAAAEQNAGSEDSGAVEDDLLDDDNCDDYGRCRHCNLHEPQVLTIKRQQLMSSAISSKSRPDDEISEDVAQDDDDFERQEIGCEEVEVEEEAPTREFTPSPRHTSPAIVATKMLRRKMTRHWRQQAASMKSGNRLVNKLVLMRRAMAATANAPDCSSNSGL